MRNGKSAKSNGNGTAVATKARVGRVDVGPEEAVTPDRLPVLKTYKIYVNGKFPRTESGRYYVARAGGSAAGEPLANVCLCSRKDFRDAVVAARAAQGPWAARTAYNRGQVLYRVAEMLEGRAAQFVAEMVSMGATPAAAAAELAVSVDRLLYYAGWADKYQQVFSSVNPVSSSHFNFSVLEPTGVVAGLAVAARLPRPGVEHQAALQRLGAGGGEARDLCHRQPRRPHDLDLQGPGAPKARGRRPAAAAVGDPAARIGRP